MNNFPITLTVESSDGVKFTVDTMTLNVVGERSFARSKTAAELDAHGDFKRVVRMYDTDIVHRFRTECYAFFFWHRHKYPRSLGETACTSGAHPKGICNRTWRFDP